MAITVLSIALVCISGQLSAGQLDSKCFDLYNHFEWHEIGAKPPTAKSFQEAIQSWEQGERTPQVARSLSILARSVTDFQNAEKLFLQGLKQSKSVAGSTYGEVCIIHRLIFDKTVVDSIGKSNCHALGDMMFSHADRLAFLTDYKVPAKSSLPVMCVAIDSTDTEGLAFRWILEAAEKMGSTEYPFLNYRIAERYILGVCTPMDPYPLKARQCLERIPKSKRIEWRFNYIMGWSFAVEGDRVRAKYFLNQSLKKLDPSSIWAQQIHEYFLKGKAKSLEPRRIYVSA